VEPDGGSQAGATTAVGGADAPYGPWATAGLGLGVLAMFVAAQVAVGVGAVALELARHPGADLGRVALEAGGNGLVLAVATWASALVGVGLVLLLIRMRGGGAAAYLWLAPVRGVRLVWSLLAVVAFGALYDLACTLLARPTVPPFMREAYSSAGWPPLLWSALVVAAPLFEELFFRGFLLEGFRRSRLGSGGAIALTAALWAAIHLQYGPFDLAAVAVLGVVLGVIRLRTGSLWSCVAAHALVNLVATVQTALEG
jgi:uncharacterized protein